MTSESYYRASTVVAVTGVAHETLKMWHKRGQFVTDQDARSQWTGEAHRWRSYSVEDMVRISAILQIQKDLGVELGCCRALAVPEQPLHRASSIYLRQGKLLHSLPFDGLPFISVDLSLFRMSITKALRTQQAA